MNKKGVKFLGGHVVNIVIAVIVVLLLVYLVVKVYGLIEDNKREKAEIQLKKIVEIINQVNGDGQARKVEVFPPGDDWFLRTFPLAFPVGECRGLKESCLCICSDCNDPASRACNGFDFEIKTFDYDFKVYLSYTPLGPTADELPDYRENEISLKAVTQVIITKDADYINLIGGAEFEDEEKTKIVGDKKGTRLISKFDDFLESNIIASGKEEKIIDAIQSSLDSYFEVKNNKGENFFVHFDLEDIRPARGELRSVHLHELRNKMSSEGFSEEDYSKVINPGFRNERGNKIIEELDKFCDIGKFEYCAIELPYGIIVKERLAMKYSSWANILGGQNPRIYPNSIEVNTNYKGENFKIIFLIDVDEK